MKLRHGQAADAPISISQSDERSRGGRGSPATGGRLGRHMTAEVIAAAPLRGRMVGRDGRHRRPHRLPHVPAVRGDLRPRDRGRRRADRLHPRRREDVFSHGFICPKGSPARSSTTTPTGVRTPLIRERAGFREATWDEAFALIDERLPPILAEDRNAVGRLPRQPERPQPRSLLYAGCCCAPWARATCSPPARSTRCPSMASGLMFGTGTTVPVPDVDRTDYLLMLGANPLASNGSLMTAPDMRGRLRRSAPAAASSWWSTRAARGRPRRPTSTTPSAPAPTRTAVRAGHTLFAEGLAEPGGGSAALLHGLDEVARAGRAVRARGGGAGCGIAADRSGAWPASWPPRRRAAVYGRIGTSTQEFGTLASWLVDVLNVLTGNLDRAGGAMFPRPPPAPPTPRAAGPRPRRALRPHAAACAGCAELFGELPVGLPGRGDRDAGRGPDPGADHGRRQPGAVDAQQRPPRRGARALDFMVSVDIYLNETTRHADVILPAPSPLRRGHYDLALLPVRRAQRRALLPAGARARARAARRVGDTPAPGRDRLGQGPDADWPRSTNRSPGRSAARGRHRGRRPPGATPPRSWPRSAPRLGPERLLDFMLRTGPYGDGFGHKPGRAEPGRAQGGPARRRPGAAEPRLPEVLRTPSGKIELAAGCSWPTCRGCAPRWTAPPAAWCWSAGAHVRSNNSWMHNLPMLVKGKHRCTLQIHPDDAARSACVDGDWPVSSRTGRVEAQVEVTDEIMPGVVSLPHGWGHDLPACGWRSPAHAGVNINILADEI